MRANSIVFGLASERQPSLRGLRSAFFLLTIFFGASFYTTAAAQDLIISISNPPAQVNLNAVGQSQFYPSAGTLGVGGPPISLRATVTAITAGDSIRLFTSGDNPVVRTNTGSIRATVLWEVFDAVTGAPVSGNPDFLITDIDGRNGTPIESVSAACAGLTSYTVNGSFANGETNIRVTESGGAILGEGTQNQNGNQQEGYLQYSWTNVSSWEVEYISTNSGRWFVHDADGDIPFDGTEVEVNLTDLATIKRFQPGTNTAPAPGEQVTYEVELSNAGPSIATGANLVDTLPVGMTLVNASATAGDVTPSGNNIAWDNVTIPVGSSEVLTITASVNTGVVPGTVLTNETNTAIADQNKCSDRDVLTVDLTVSDPPAPSLTIEKSVDPVTSFNQAGDTITYSYLITNTGNVQIDGVTPTDSGPSFNMAAGTNMLSAFAPAPLSLAAGDSQVFTAIYQLSQDDVDNMAQAADPLTAIDNTASATGNPVEGSLAPVTPSTVETGFAPAPMLTVAKSVTADTVFDGANDTITYQYVVTNTGNIQIDDVTPTDAGPTFNGAPATGTLSAFSPAPVSLEPNESETFTATYELSQVDVDNMAAAIEPLTAIDNTASANGDPIGATALPAVAESLAETGFAPAPMLEIEKTVSTATTFSAAGDTITYQYVVSNTGNVTVNNVVPTDSGPTFNLQAATNTLSAFNPSSASIAPNSSQTFTATYLIDQADVDNMSQAGDPTTSIDNTASAVGTPVGGVLPTVADNSAETGFAINVELNVVKTAGAPTTSSGTNAAATDAGDTISYSFDVTNDGDVTISSISINDSGPTFNSVAGTGTLSAINCALTSLAPTQMTTCTAEYTLSQADVDNAIIGGADSIENSAVAEGQNPANGAVSSPAADATQSITADSAIEVDKSAAPPTVTAGADATLVDPGDSIDYQFEITNTGNTTLSNVQLTDDLVPPVCPATTDLGNAFVNDGTSTLAVGDSITCTATYVLDQTNLDDGGVVNTATVNALDPTNAGVSDMDTVNTAFTQKASLSLIKSATPLPDPAVEGAPITYTFEVTNTGNVSLSDVEVADPICETPTSPLTFASGYQSGDAQTVGVLDAGEVWVFECEYTIDLPDINAGEVTNTATASGTPPPASGLSDPSSTASNLVDAAQNAAIALDKTASLPTTAGGDLPGVTDAGDTVSYTFLVENTGNVTLDDVVVSDPLITEAPNSGTITCPSTPLTLAPGEQATCTATYTLTLDDLNGGMVDNLANVVGSPPPSVPPAGQPMADSSAVVTLPPEPLLSIEKTVAPLPSPLMPGSLISYSYEVTNTGNVSIADVAPIDAGPTFNGNPAVNALSSFTPENADLDPGETLVFTATYPVDQTDIDNIATAADQLTAIDNTATANGDPEGGTLDDATPSTAETGVVTTPAVTLTKSSTPPAIISAGQAISYSFNLTNSGDVRLSNPTITDAQCESPASPLTFSSGYVSGDAGQAGVLDVDETWVFSCTYTLLQSDIDAGTVQNSALGAGTDPAGNITDDVSDSTNPGDTGAANDDPTNTPLPRTPAWMVEKSTASEPTREGDTLVYQFLLTNQGNVSISNPVVTDAKCASAPVLIGGDLDNNNVLAPTEVFSYECTSIAVMQAEVDAGTVNNAVSVTGTPPTGSPALPPATDNLQTPIARVPSLSIDKQSEPATTGLGMLASATDELDMISYTFTVTNDGNVTVSGISVVDSGPTFDGAAGAGTWSGVSCVLDELIPDQSTICTANYVLDQADIDAAIAGGIDSVVNDAQAQGTAPGTTPVSSPTASAAETITPLSTVEIEKTAGDPSTGLGADPDLTDALDTVDYQLAVTNTGNNQLDNVLISDSIATVVCPATTALGAIFNNGTGSLAVGDSIVCTAQYELTQLDIDRGLITNTANVDAVDQAGLPVNGVSEIDVGLTQKTSVSLSKTVVVFPNNPAQVNDVITYEFELDNTGNVSLSDAQIVDDKCDAPGSPLNLSSGFVSGDTNLDQLLNSDEVWTFRCDHTVTQTEVNAGGVENSAVGSGVPPVDSGLPNPSSGAGTIAELGQETGLSLDKVGGMPTVVNGAIDTLVDEGDTISYTFTVVNTGNVTLTDIVISDPLITDAPNNGTIDCTFPVTDGALNSGESATCTADYTLTLDDVNGSTVMNEADVTGNPPDTVPPGSPATASSSAMVPVPAAPSLSIEKTASLPANIAAGTLVTYTYVVTNTGNVSINSVAPIDLGPTFNGVSGTNALSPYSPETADLAPGEQETFTATYEISQVDLDNLGAASDPATAIDNEASADGEPANGILAAVIPDTAETGEAPAPEINLIKTSTPPAVVAAGAVVTYDFSLSNDGNVSISSPRIADVLCQSPAGPLTFTNGFLAGDTGAQPGVLDVGETWTFSCGYAITQDDIDAGTVQNTATASGEDPSGTTQEDVSDTGNSGDGGAADNDPTNTALARNPAFSVMKSTNSTPDVLGDTLLYEFLVTNTGNVSINNINVIDAKCNAAGATLDASTDIGTLGVLSPAGAGGSPPAEQWLFTCTSLPIDQDDIDLGRIDNEVTVTGEAPGGNPANAEDMISTPIITNPELSLVKAAGVVQLNDDGSFDQSFDFALKNTGDITMNTVSFTDNIPAQFGACFDSIVSPGTVSLADVPPASDSASPSLGSAPVIATTSRLAVGDTISVTAYVVRFNPNASGCTFPTPAQNTATAMGSPANGAPPITDVSDSGTDPDVGTPNDTGTPTPFTPPVYAPELGLAKAAGVPSLNADGSFDVAYTLSLENTGNVDITGLSLEDDLAAQMGPAFVASNALDQTGGVLVAPEVTLITDSGTANTVLPGANLDFDGSAGSDLFDAAPSYLGVGDRIQIVFTIRLNPFAAGAPTELQNTATVSGSDPSGAETVDDSDSGSDPTDNSGGPGSPTTVTPPPFMTGLEVIKNGTFNADGTITYEFSIRNTGEVNIADVALSDDLITDYVFPAGTDADNDQDIDLLAPDEVVIVTATYTLLEADFAAGQVENTAAAEGTDPAGNPVSDVSDSGNPADDTGADDDPTVTPFAEPSIGAAKDVAAGSPVDLGNGSYQMTYQFVISNLGPVDLDNVQLSDDLQAMINNPNVNNASVSNAVVTSPNSTLTPNPSYDGINNLNLLTGADTLVVGASGLVQLSFVFTPDVYFGPFLNQAEATAEAPGGVSVSDLSEDGNTVNPETDSVTPFSIATPSTPINLGWFKSSGDPSLVVFEWATEVEVSNAGFYLSVKDEQGFWQRINQDMIPAQGDSTEAQSYAYIAYNVGGETFMLTDVSVTGQQVDHGPFKLGEEFGVRAERRATNWDKIRSESERKRQEREQQRRQEIQQRMQELKPQTGVEHKAGFWQRLAGVVLSALVAPVNAAELASFEVSEPGLYKVTHADLMNKGLDLRGIAIERISIEESNEPWPIKIVDAANGNFSANSWIMFPGRGLDTLYSGVNKYTLVLDEEPPITITDDDSPIPDNTAIAYSYLAEATYAPQNNYTHISPSERDAWYADSLRAITAPTQKQISLTIEDYAPALNTAFNISGLARMPSPRPRLEVNLWGSSDLPGNGVTNPDHHVLIDLNAEQVADVRFDGVREYPVTKVVTNLAYGENTVNVSLPKDTGYQFDLVNLDRISLHYPRLFSAINNGSELVFESPWNFFKVSNLASDNALVVRVDQDRGAYLMTERGEGQCSSGCAYFSGSATDEVSTYFVAASNRLRSAEITLLSAETDIISGAANYLLIAHPDFIGTPLQAYRNQLAQKFGSADIVNVEDIYAQYSGHVVDASAIKDYIADAYDARGTRRVALIGGDMYDYRNNLNTGAQSFVPSLYVQIATNVNAVPSDASYADIDDDLIPDIAVTRFPVRTSAELTAMLNKRVSYLERDYINSAVIAADKADASGYDFDDDAQELANSYLSAWNVASVALDDTSVANGKLNLIGALNQGASLTAYFGHSSTDRWSISGLFTSQDVASLQTNRPSVITQWGCWNTFYVSPTQDSLAQRLLTDGQRGAVTLMGATSFTKADAEQRMAMLLFERLTQGMNIGDAVLSAKQALAQETPYQLDVLLGWAVLGPDDFSVTPAP